MGTDQWTLWRRYSLLSCEPQWDRRDEPLCRYLCGGAFISTNNGTSWTAVNTGLTDLEVSSFAVVGTNLFAGTSGGGAFLSTNNGASWTAINTGLTNTYVRSFAISGTNLFAGTYGGGVWRRPLSEMITSVSLLPGEIPQEFTLEQNYPNPFNPSTKISWQSPVGSHQTIKVFDVLGNEIATLVDEYKSAGIYNVQFTMNNFASGIYFYQLKAGSYNQTKKMVVVK